MKVIVKAYKKFLKNKLLIRIMLLGLFIGFDLMLIKGLVDSQSIYWPFPNIQTTEVESDLSKDSLLTQLNQLRENNQNAPLTEETQLNNIAHKLLILFKENNYELENNDINQKLSDFTKESEFEFQHLSNIATVASLPLYTDEVINSWLTNQQQHDIILSEKFNTVGIAYEITDIEGIQYGIVTLIFADKKEAKIVDSDQPSTSMERDPSSVKQNQEGEATTSQSTARIVSDDEVFTAINQYRADHGIHALLINNNLCQYAEKRVQDLIAYGGLDNHAGFRSDFEVLENLPQSIKDYPGTTIGENLASQYCINGTTGDFFIAQTGTALIEWCFDSSVKGHREAQLNPAYNNVCIRHGENMYVVIFGE